MPSPFRSAVFATAFVCTAPAGAVTFSANYESERERETNRPAQGFSVVLSQDFASQAFGDVTYSQLRTDPYQDGGLTGREQYSAAGADIGAWLALSESSEVSATAGYVLSETRGLDEFQDDPVDRVHGPSGSLTLSYRPHKWTELFIGPSYSYLGREPGWTGTAGLSLKMTRHVWIGASYWAGQLKDGFNAGFRADFGGV